MQNLKILAVQSDLHWEDPTANHYSFEKRIETDFDSHDLIILPETFTTGFPVNPRVFSETTEGPTVKWMKNISSKFNVVVTGTILIQSEKGYANTLIWMSPDGSFSSYEKRHVFTMGGEHNNITPGNERLIVDLKGWKICPMICYDLRFPVWSKNSYKDNMFEYDIAIFVANWPAVRSFPWKTLLLARAIENQAYIIGLNRIGEDNSGISYSGDSMIVDPKGKIISQAQDNKPESLSAVLSYAELQNFRNNFNVGPDWDKFNINL
jgi:omega-amidase